MVRAVWPNRSAAGGAESPRFLRHAASLVLVKEWNLWAPRRCSKEPCCGGETSLFNALGTDAKRGRADFNQRSLQRSHLEAFVKFREGAVKVQRVDSDAKCNPVDSIGSSTKVGFPSPNAGLLLGFQGTKTARRGGISSPFSDAGGCAAPELQGGV